MCWLEINNRTAAGGSSSTSNSSSSSSSSTSHSQQAVTSQATHCMFTSISKIDIDFNAAETLIVLL
jgi:hypothetical protein